MIAYMDSDPHRPEGKGLTSSQLAAHAERDRIALHAVFVGWMDRGNLAEHLDCIPPMVTFPRRLDFTCQQMIARQTDQ